MRPVLRLTLLSVLAIPACAWQDPAGPTASTASSNGGVTSTTGAAQAEGRPVQLPFEGGYDWRIAVAPDGATALVAHSDGFFPRTRESTIYEVTRAPDGSWIDAVEPSFVSDRSADIDPAYTADGSRVWFSSIRPVGGADRADVEIWQVDRAPDGTWGEPVHAAELGSDGDDLYPSIGGDGAVYFASDRGGGGFDIWRALPVAVRGWAPPDVVAGPITTPSWEFNPSFSPDGSVMAFTAQGRASGAGAGDLFFSRPSGDSWAEPLPLESVNTAGDEYHPAFSPDGQTLYFVRDGDLFEIAVSSTELT